MSEIFEYILPRIIDVADKDYDKNMLENDDIEYFVKAASEAKLSNFILEELERREELAKISQDKTDIFDKNN